MPQSTQRLKMGAVLRHIAAPLTVTAATAALFAVLYNVRGWKWLHVSPAPFQIVGTALAIYLAFLNNAAYSRYWEARTLWGGIINNARTFARQAMTLTFCTAKKPDDCETQELTAWRHEVVYRQIAWCIALRCALRKQDPFPEMKPYLTLEDQAGLRGEQNIPIALLHRQGERLRDARTAGWLSDYLFERMDETLSTLTDLQGGCERINNTPIPLTYTYLTHRFVYGYCALLPLGLLDQVDERMFWIVLPVATVFLILDRIGSLIEHPFGTEPQDLALSSYTRTIEINLLQRLRETNLPDPITPVEGVLR
jgi:ion channel-forming bestrophin family protein